MQQPPQKRKCLTCYFARLINTTCHCIKTPPALDANTGLARWPIVKKSDICGQFRYAEQNHIDSDRWPKNDLPIYKDRFGDYCKIHLTQGRFAKVDPEDYIWLSQFRWHCHKRERTSYAVRTVWEKNRAKKILMHRLITETPGHLVCDHINRNGLDNRKQNLRNCTKRENNLNQPSQRNSTSKYKGVYWNKRMKKWAACIKMKGEQRHLGYFEDEAEAAKAYDEAAKKYHGEFAGLNFQS